MHLVDSDFIWGVGATDILLILLVILGSIKMVLHFRESHR